MKPDILEQMAEALAHRGPDDAAVWSEGPIGLGHLMFHTTPESLLEHQPLVARDGDLVLTADARIDNREELIERFGFDQPADEVTDAELILAAYTRWGERCAEQLLGDFAFAVWDGVRRTLLCVKDHFGVRPLYFCHKPGLLFAFASEIKALLLLDEVSDEIDEMEIAHHFFIPVERDLGRTYFRDVRRGLPMHTLLVSESNVKARRYWQPDPTSELTLGSDEEYAEALREILAGSIRARLRSTGNVASMLSGGLDSSSIVCMASRILEETNGGRLMTLSAIYPQVPASDEQNFIQSVVDDYEVEPRFFEADAVSPLAEMRKMMWYGDSAHLGHHIYLLWALQRDAAGAGCRVVFHGFDGDTTISHGNHYLTELAMAKRWIKLAWVVMPYAYRIGGPSPLAAYWAWIRRYGLSPVIQNSRLKSINRVFRRTSPAVRKTVPKWELVMNPEFLLRISDEMVPVEPKPDTERENHASRFMDKLLLDALTGVTALATGAGVELRLPFLDKRLVEFCISIPADQKLRRGYSRFVLRKAMAGILPRKIQWRARKSNVALGWRHAMLSHGMGDVDAIVSRINPRVEEWIDVNRLRTLSRRFKVGSDSVAEELVFWRALTLALWLAPSGLEHETSGRSAASRGLQLDRGFKARVFTKGGT